MFGYELVEAEFTVVLRFVPDHITCVGDTPESLRVAADAIEYLYLNPEVAKSLSKMGRNLVMDKFNLETCVEPLISEFKKRATN